MTRLEDLQERWEKQDDIRLDDYAWLLGHAAGLQAHVHELLKDEKPKPAGGLWDQRADPNNPVFDFLKELTPEKIAAVWDSLDKEELVRIIMERTKPYRTSRLSHAEMMEPLGDAPPMSVHEEPLSQEDIEAIIDSSPKCECGHLHRDHNHPADTCLRCIVCPKFRALP